MHGAALMTGLRRLLRREDGTATIEFVIVFPVFITMFLSVFEIGLLMTQDVMLNRGLNVAVRALRLSSGDSTITHDDVKEMICDNSLILKDCTDRLQLEMVQIDTSTWAMPDSTADCIDTESDIEPVVTFSTGAEGSIMFIRACLLVDPFFPGSALASQLTTDGAGYYQMTATSAFANEPS